MYANARIKWWQLKRGERKQIHTLHKHAHTYTCASYNASQHFARTQSYLSNFDTPWTGSVYWIWCILVFTYTKYFFHFFGREKPVKMKQKRLHMKFTHTPKEWKKLWEREREKMYMRQNWKCKWTFDMCCYTTHLSTHNFKIFHKRCTFDTYVTAEERFVCISIL